MIELSYGDQSNIDANYYCYLTFIYMFVVILVVVIVPVSKIGRFR
jgi:hypothetical protein